MDTLLKQKSLTDFFQSKVKKTILNEPLLKEKTVIDAVPGLLIVKNFITEAEETCLWKEVNKLPWEPLGNRKMMKLGYRHDPQNKTVMKHLGELPEPFQFVISRILEDKLMSRKPEQCVVNYYDAGHGVYPHIDRIEDYGSEIAGLSLNSDIVMEFHGPKGERIELFVPRRSLYIIEGVARFDWKHTIPARTKDKLENGLINIRKQRISLTFRTVELGFRKPKK